ncbi:MAG: tetratricopeptide repeat protein, partial [Candidatus Cloacimonadota bacterium]|nr:tetratricopeptide repeat protein [Candidatus Cloacimonadota bacterium]
MSDIDNLLLKAKELYEKEKLEESKSKLVELLKDDPENSEAIILLGNIYHELKDEETAEKYLKKGLEKDPDNALVKLVLAKTYVNQEKIDESLELLEQIKDVEMEEALAKNRDEGLAILYMTQAQELIDKAAELPEDDDQALFDLRDKIEEYYKKIKDLKYKTDETKKDMKELEELLYDEADPDTSEIDNYFENAPKDEEPDTEEWEDKDRQAAKLLEEAFETWTVVDRDKENEIEYRKPTKKKQIEKSQKLIDQAAAKEPKHNWVQNRITELRDVLDRATNKVFEGSYKLMIAAVLFSVFFWMLPGLKGCSKASEVTLQQAQAELTRRIKQYEENIPKYEEEIAQLKKGEEANPQYTKEQIKERLDRREKWLKDAKKELKKIDSMDAEKYRKVMISRRNKTGWNKFWRAIFYLICVVLYYFVSKTPQFLLDKRHLEKKIMAVGGNIGKSIWNGISNFLINQPSGYTTRYRYSDGSHRDETSINPAPIIGIVLKIGIPLLWYFINITLLPIIIII